MYQADAVDWVVFADQMAALRDQLGRQDANDVGRAERAAELRRQAAAARAKADAYRQIAEWAAGYAETAARAFHAADQLEADVRKAGCRDPETIESIVVVQEIALEFAQAACAARDNALQRAEAAEMAAADLEAQAEAA
jgi:hypothetical protein